MLFDSVGKEPNFFFAPLWLFDVIIDSLQWISDTFDSENGAFDVENIFFNVTFST